MIERIHLDPKLEKCLATLRKGSRRASLVADRVETIIADLKRGQSLTEELCSYSRRGEARIKGCRKFDLGAGYRLVTMLQEQDLYLLYVGTHDDCTRWIENNRAHFLLDVISDRCKTVRRQATDSEERQRRAEAPSEPTAEADWLPPIDDKDLRIIFSGLVEGP
jgi:mRNA-degrading endonuclease YafQ of YafQ-DinJ toxin-antitoxin module